MPTAKIFVMVGDASLARRVARVITAAGYEPTTCRSAHDLAAAYHDGPGCVVLDLQLAGGPGLEVLQALECHQSALRPVALAGPTDVAASIAAMKHGAVDVLLKPVDEEELLSAVATGLAQSLAQWQLHQEGATLLRRFETLTPRERQVCRLVAAGYLNKQAAYELGTAEKTIKVHRARVMSKLEVGSVPELVRFVDRLDFAVGFHGVPASRQPASAPMPETRLHAAGPH